MRQRVGFGLIAAVVLFGVIARAGGPIPATPASTTPATAADPTAEIQTSLGTITVALDRAHAPATVANFISYAKEGHFDGTVIYRVARGFVLQMGSYDANGAARPTHAPVALETSAGLSNVRGSVAMARADAPLSATAEFFINLDNNARLDADAKAPPNTTGYAVFGRVIRGMDVVDKIAAVPTGGDGPFPPQFTPATPVVIQKVKIADAPATEK